MNAPAKLPAITMQPVANSSQVSHVGHDGDTLEVAFKSGATYHYHGVTTKQYADLLGAESIGKHLNAHIKPNHQCTPKPKDKP